MSLTPSITKYAARKGADSMYLVCQVKFEGRHLFKKAVVSSDGGPSHDLDLD